MSSCLIIQTHDEIYIGADTAISTNVDGKNLRVSLPDKRLHTLKITPIGDMIVFLSGMQDYILPTHRFLVDNPKATHEEIQQWLKQIITKLRYKNNDSGEYGLTLVICKVLNGKSYAWHYATENDYAGVEYSTTSNNVNVVSAGFNTDIMKETAIRLLRETTQTGDTLLEIFPKTFESASCNEVGGNLYMYRISDQALIIENIPLNEKGIEYLTIQDASQIDLPTFTTDIKLVLHCITATQIQAGTIDATLISANAIRANHIQSNAIDADKIAANSIRSIHIQAGAILADKINVNQLSAISANMGTITAGEIRGGSITSNSIINVTTDINVGNWINLLGAWSGGIRNGEASITFDIAGGATSFSHTTSAPDFIVSRYSWTPLSQILQDFEKRITTLEKA